MTLSSSKMRDHHACLSCNSRGLVIASKMIDKYNAQEVLILGVKKISPPLGDEESVCVVDLPYTWIVRQLAAQSVLNC